MGSDTSTPPRVHTIDDITAGHVGAYVLLSHKQGMVAGTIVAVTADDVTIETARGRLACARRTHTLEQLLPPQGA